MLCVHKLESNTRKEFFIVYHFEVLAVE